MVYYYVGAPIGLAGAIFTPYQNTIRAPTRLYPMNSVNEDDVDWTEKAHDSTRFRRRHLGKAAGSER